ncbi:MAG TPA: endonuclease/exonuclease/phosphatase family protein [Drouetiella sp.]|jgi:endonuclease/exonuclease/phosphatase (EEP) superfamily protein YafD
MFVGISASLVAICGFVPHVWLFDLASQLRLALEMILIICVVVLVTLRSHLAATFVLIGLFINTVPLARMYVKQTCPENKNTQSITILNFNTEFQHNGRFDLLKNLVNERLPDIIALVEVDKKWINAIEPATSRYPYNKVVLEGPGLALYSFFPIEKCDVRYFGRSHHPRIIATLRVGTRELQILIAHPTTPQTDTGFDERNQEISIIQNEISQMTSPKILIGDLNCGPWSPVFEKLLSSGLRDSQQGFGPHPSWPARTGRVFEKLLIPPMVPIDHILISPELCVTNRIVGPALESDHLPVFARIICPK